MNYICAVLMIADAVLRTLTFFDVVYVDTSTGDIFFYILTFYLLTFSGLLLSAELRWPRVLVYFEFLKSRLGKGFYLVLVGLLVFDERRKISLSLGIALVLVGFFNIIVSCMRRDTDQQEWEEQNNIRSNKAESKNLRYNESNIAKMKDVVYSPKSDIKNK